MRVAWAENGVFSSSIAAMDLGWRGFTWKSHPVSEVGVGILSCGMSRFLVLFESFYSPFSFLESVTTYKNFNVIVTVSRWIVTQRLRRYCKYLLRLRLPRGRESYP